MYKISILKFEDAKNLLKNCGLEGFDYWKTSTKNHFKNYRIKDNNPNKLNITVVYLQKCKYQATLVKNNDKNNHIIEKPKDISELTYFLLNHSSNSFNGTLIDLEGGVTTK